MNWDNVRCHIWAFFGMVPPPIAVPPETAVAFLDALVRALQCAGFRNARVEFGEQPQLCFG